MNIRPEFEHILLVLVLTQCRTFIYLFCYNFRRRTHACSFWGYKYLGSSKTLAPEWNNKFINFIPFLCCLTEDTIPEMKKLCAMESKGALLFQRPLSEITAVWLFLNWFSFYFLYSPYHFFRHCINSECLLVGRRKLLLLLLSVCIQKRKGTTPF